MFRRFRWLWPLLIILLIAAALLEAGLRLAVPLLPERLATPARWVMYGAPYAQSWTPAWQQNIDHYYALRPGLENVLQYGSASVSFHLSTIELWEGGGIGFRNRPVDYFVDAVAVGDSFTFCFTEREDCWVTHLENATGMGMVNLGQPVTGTTSHLRILQGFGAPMTPPLVIWQFFGNDFNDDYGLAVFRDEIDAVPDDSPPPGSSVPVIGWLRTHSVAFAVLETAFTGQWHGLPEEARIFANPYRVTYGEHVLEFGAQYEQRALDMARPQNQIGLALSREAFRAARDLVATWDGRLVVVIFPTREEVYEPLTAPQMGEAAMNALRSAREAMLALCAELGLTCYDLLADLQAHARQNEALYYPDDMHFNPYGNTVVADLIRQWLSTRALLPE